MVAPLDAATRQSIIEQAQAIAAQQGISPEQALWNYAQGQGLSASDVDTYMGFPAGATQNWAVLNGQAPAPQGNFNPTVQAAPPPPPPAPAPPAPAPTPVTPVNTTPTPVPVKTGVQPLDAATRQYVINEAQKLAGPGVDYRRALLDYATKEKIGVQDIDTLMGYAPGEMAAWATKNVQGFNPAGTQQPTTPVTPVAPVAPAATTTTAPAATQTAPQNATVAEWYRTVLKREPDAAGMSFWTDVLNKNGPEAARQSFNASAQKELIDSKQVQQPGSPPPPPTWQDSFNEFNKKHIAQYGKEINRPWNEDADSRRAKQTIDDLYMASLKDYNAKYKTDIAADGAVLGPTAQPNTYTPDPKTGNNFLTKLAVTAASVALAPVTGGASLWAGPAMLGVSEAVKTGDIGKGLVTGALSAAGTYGANSLFNGTGAAGAANVVPAGTQGAYTLTGDAIADAAGLNAAGYSSAQIGSILGGGVEGGAMAIGTTLGAASGGGGMLSAIQNGWNGITGAANAAGGVTGSQLLTTGASLLGGYLNQQAASDAAKTQADAQIRAAQIAADAAKFKPVGVKTNFGQSDFGYDANGNINRAGYTLDPRLYQQQNQLLNAAPGMLNNFTNSQQYLQPMVDAASKAAEIGGAQAALGEQNLNLAHSWRPDPNFVRNETAPLNGAAQNAMALGNQYLQTSPQQQAAKYMAEQQGLLAPGRANDMAALQAQMQAQGRGGLMVGGGVNGQGASNPQMQALLNARMQQDAQLAANATQGGMDYAKFGIDTVNAGGGMLRDVYGTQAAAYQPYNAAQQAAQNQANFGIGMSGAAGNMMRDVFSTQTAAFAPYQQAM